MKKAVTPEPALLFRFALREHDWVLADLLARHAAGNPSAIRRMKRELSRPGRERTAPRTFASLRCLATVTRELDLDNGASG